MPTHSTTEDAKAAKNRRLADALRANLRRRKAARAAVDSAAPAHPSSNGHDRARDDDLDKE